MGSTRKIGFRRVASNRVEPHGRFARNTKIARKVTKELLAWNGPFALRQLTRAFSPVLGCDKSFVTFRETFVSRCAAETPEGWRLRERQRPSLLESSDARADSNRPSGRFRGGAGFRGSREAPVRLHEHKTFTALVMTLASLCAYPSSYTKDVWHECR